MDDLSAVMAKDTWDPRVRSTASRFRAGFDLDQPVDELRTGDGVVLTDATSRFLPPGVSLEELPPSFALAGAFEVVGPASTTAPVPRFGVSRDGRWVAQVDIPAGTAVYGTGMTAGPLERSDQRTTCWNTDFPGYSDSNPSLYQSHPWVVAVRPDGSAFGVLADTTFRATIDLTAIDASGGRIRFIAEGMPYPVYVLEGDHPGDVVQELARLTGTMPMPARWTLGYHQCRWSYYPQGRALRIAEEFRSRRIPCDCIWFDIHYMDRYRIFTFDPQRFPDPRSLNDRLHTLGFRSVWMIDPAPAVDESYDVYVQATEGEHALIGPDGAPYHGEVWPGKTIFPDFSRAETRTWWAGLYKDFLAHGIDGVWNDMNEPANFVDVTKTVPENCWHRGGDDLPAAPHALYHNVYGMLMVRASREGMQQAQPDRRPFILTRSNFIGGHRYAATWTGDNSATWDDLRWSITMCLNLGLSGQPFVGPDIGGFMDFGEGDPKLFARWMGIGCLLPFARGHVVTGSIDKEPWSMGPACEATCRRAIERRYRLLPYLYTVFRETHTDGLPVIRPAFFGAPGDASSRSIEHAFLLGRDLLAVCDVLENAAPGTAEVPAFAREWPRIDPLIDAEADVELPRLYLRPGAILPIGPVMQYSDEQPVDPLTLIVAPGADGKASGLLYEDAGDGYEFERGAFRLTTFRFAGGSLGEPEVDGAFEPGARRIEHVVAGGS
ncbi:MAG: TIM-barrel domain-containing protein [Planctomycetota bacterium]